MTLGFFPVSKLARCPVGYGQDPSAVGVPMHTSDEGCDLNGMAKTSPRVQFIWIPPIISRLSITALAGYLLPLFQGCSSWHGPPCAVGKSVPSSPSSQATPVTGVQPFISVLAVDMPPPRCHFFIINVCSFDFVILSRAVSSDHAQWCDVARGRQQKPSAVIVLLLCKPDERGHVPA